jgi:hypothetical protein
VSIYITADQVRKLAPDDKSVKAGTKLSNVQHWKNLGQSEEAIWGECQGSTLYKVGIITQTLTTRCTCPSKKLPCKHALGLLFMIANTAQHVPISEELPEWVEQWLKNIDAARKRKEAAQAKGQDSEKAAASKAKNAAKREQKVQQGIEQLNLWLNDLLRNGLGSLNTQSTKLWEQRTAQLVDAQASGLATRVRALGGIPHTSDNWMERLLAQLGKIALLTEAYAHPERFSPAQYEDIRQLVGWSLKTADVMQNGEHIKDEWLVLGQVTDETERGYMQRTWLQGLQSNRTALILQFAMGAPNFDESFPLGFQIQAELAFWPGQLAQRAIMIERQIQHPIETLPHGAATLDAMLAQVAQQLGLHPWQERFLAIVHNCVPRYDSEHKSWFVQDSTGSYLPLRSDDKNWELLAYSGGHPVALVAEWDGQHLRPVSVMAEHFSLLLL